MIHVQTNRSVLSLTRVLAYSRQRTGVTITFLYISLSVLDNRKLAEYLAREGKWMLMGLVDVPGVLS